MTETQAGLAGLNVAVLRRKAGCTDCLLEFKAGKTLAVNHNGQRKYIRDFSGAWVTDLIEWMSEAHG